MLVLASFSTALLASNLILKVFDMLVPILFALRKAFQIKVMAPDSVVGHYLGLQLKNGKTGFISKTIRDNHFVAKIKKQEYTPSRKTPSPRS